MDYHAVPNLNRLLLFYSLFLAYICAGIISVLPGASLLLLAENTHVALDIAGSSFTLSALGFAIGVLIAGVLTTKLNSKYILLYCLLIIVPFALAIWQQRHTLHLLNDGHTMKEEKPLSTKAQK